MGFVRFALREFEGFFRGCMGVTINAQKLFCALKCTQNLLRKFKKVKKNPCKFSFFQAQTPFQIHF